MGRGLYSVTVCMVGCYWSKDPRILGAKEPRILRHPTIQTVTLYSPRAISLLRHWATIQQAHAELPENGAYEAPKHVGVN
jgi:hypothetical protein